MQQDKYFPVSSIEQVSDAESATGQKNYALAWNRAKLLQFNGQCKIDTPGNVHQSAEALRADSRLVQKRILYQRKI